MVNPKAKIRSWRLSIGEAIAVAKSKREFEKVLENRPYNIVQCEAAHRWAEHLAAEVAPALSGGGSDQGLPDLGTRTKSTLRILPWHKVDVNLNRVSHQGWNPGDPIDVVRRATVEETFRVGSTYHLIPLDGDETPPLVARISRVDNSADITTSYGLLRHRNTAAYINCMECHNYATQWLGRMVIPGSPPDQKSVKIGRFARAVTWLALVVLAFRGLFLTSDLVDIYSHIETAIEWLTPGT